MSKSTNSNVYPDSPRNIHSRKLEYGADTKFSTSGLFSCRVIFFKKLVNACNKISKYGRPECRCCFVRHVAGIEGPDRKMWLTGATRLVNICSVLCCATSGSKNWLMNNSVQDCTLVAGPDGVFLLYPPLLHHTAYSYRYSHYRL